MGIEMSYRNGTYCAFYVDEPFYPSNLGALATKDFVYYNLVRMWKHDDPSFPFVNSHDKTYNVRDGSDWEGTLRPRLRERLRGSKNILLFLSDVTKPSRALNEEMDYGIGYLGLPVIVAYPDLDPINHNGFFNQKVFGLWDALPAFKSNMHKAPTVHIPMKKDAVREALSSSCFMIQTKIDPGTYRL